MEPIDHFIVARSDGHWKVSFHGTEESPYETKDDAIAAAVEAAKVQSANGLAVEVLVQDIDSKFHTAWRSGSTEAGDGLLSTSV